MEEVVVVRLLNSFVEDKVKWYMYFRNGMMFQFEKEGDRSEPWLKVIGNGKSRYSPNLPSQSLWIERKLFCAFTLSPGRTIRVIEMLSDRRYTVDFKANELPWLIGALREAGTTKSGSDFSKQVSIGRRSMVLAKVFNWARAFIKLMVSFGGKRGRHLFIPAGENSGGWGALANFLASVSNGGNDKKTVSPPVNHPSKGVSSQRQKTSVLPNISFAEAVNG